MSLYKRIVRPGQLGSARDMVTSVDDLAIMLGSYAGAGGSYLWDGGPMGTSYKTTYGNQQAERIGGDFTGLARQAFKDNGIVFAVMLTRMLVFSGVRFRFQSYRDGKPSDTFGSKDLSILDTPWVGGTTQDMLNRTIQDADLAGNSFWVRSKDELGQQGNELVRLRPDWVDIAVVERRYRGGVMGHQKIGYVYWEGGRWDDDREPVVLLPDEVAHFMPMPDPTANFKGMSWLTPVIRELQADKMMTTHRRKFFENGATPNMVIKHDAQADPVKVQRFAEMLQQRHGGTDNAYKTLNLYPGADLTVVGSDFRQIDFRAVQGAGETRIAAAGGVPPVIVGLSEGLQAATYSNYGQARRRLADGTMHPLWGNVAGSFAPLLPQQGRTGSRDYRLWYDSSDVPFLREDAKDSADIAMVKAQTIKFYVDAGFTPESAIKAVDAEDERLLVHTGLYSVQLQEPGSGTPAAGDTPPADVPAPPAQA